MKYLFKFIFPFLGSGVEDKRGVEFSATQNAMPPEFGRNWETELLNIRFPLSTLQCAGYSVMLIFFKAIFELYSLILSMRYSLYRLYYSTLSFDVRV